MVARKFGVSRPFSGVFEMTLPVVLKKWSEGVELPEVTSPEVTLPERGSLMYAHAQLEVGVSRPFGGVLTGNDATPKGFPYVRSTPSISTFTSSTFHSLSHQIEGHSAYIKACDWLYI